MGLDIVEFVMDVESAVGLCIPNDVAPSLATPRHVIDYLHGRLPQSRETRCLSQRAFYTIRRDLKERLGLPRESLRPQTELLAVLPTRNAQAVWAEVGESLRFPRWPSVRGGSWLARVFLHSRPRTLGDAARHVATFTPQTVKLPGEGWTWRELATVVDGLMRHHFAIREYSLDDRFVEELGLD